MAVNSGVPIPDKAGEKQLKRFMRGKYRSMPEAALEKAASADRIFNTEPRFALDQKRFSERSGRLRAAVDDAFAAEFGEGMKELEQQLGAGNDSVERLKGLSEVIRKDHLRQGLDVLCEQSNPEDLTRIRIAIQKGFAEYSQMDVAYLKRHGEWRDVELLISVAERPDYSAGLLMSFHNDERLRVTADALLSIAKGRFPELISHKMPRGLLAVVVAHATDKEIFGLDDDAIIKLCFSENDKVRKATALKVIKALPKARLKRLMARYNSNDGYRYYNVVHWLDMGLSLPKTHVKGAVMRVLAKDWPSFYPDVD